MLSINNKTPFDVSLGTVTNTSGFEYIAIYVAATFEVTQGQWQLADKQTKAPQADTYINDSPEASIVVPSQLSFNKPASDLIIIGDAVAPNGKAVTALEASVELDGIKHSAYIFGDRYWHRGNMTAPEPFTRMPLIWENAFGGRYLSNHQEQSYGPNPFGKGWLPSNAPSEMQQGLMLPNIEHPNALIRTIKDTPTPMGFSAVSPIMADRAKYAGTYDAQWQSTRAPLTPNDFDPRFFNAATQSLQIDRFIQGGESIRLMNFSPYGDLIYTLPEVFLIGQADAYDTHYPLVFKNSAVVIDTHTQHVQLFWVAHAPVLRTQAEISEIKVSLTRKTQ